MALMDEFKEEREAMKHGTPKQRLQYFWDYYKWHVIGGAFAAAMVISLITSVFGGKEEALYVAMLNSVELRQDGRFASDFTSYAGIDPNTSVAHFDTSIYMNYSVISEDTVTSAQKLAAYIAAAQLDAIAAGDELFAHYAIDGTLTDLRTVLTEEQIAAYEPYFYYVDWNVVELAAEASSNLNTDFKPEVVDPTKPELMEVPVPVGIYVESSERLTNNYYLADGDRTVLGVLPNSTHKETAAKLIDFLFETE